MTKYIKNEFGGVHSVDDQTVVERIKQNDGTVKDFTPYDMLHEVTPSGNRVLPAGWSVITAAEAKKAHPALFGASDPTVRRNAKERADAAALAQFTDPTLFESTTIEE